MAYTEKQLVTMTDSQINRAIARTVQTEVSHKTTLIPNYCESWSTTGPLMLQHQISVLYTETGDFLFACKELQTSSCYGRCVFDYLCSSENPNPLRAICEVILLCCGVNEH